MDEKAQAEQLLLKLQTLRREFSEYKSLWRVLGDATEEIEQRLRVLQLQERKSRLEDLSVAPPSDIPF